MKMISRSSVSVCLYRSIPFRNKFSVRFQSISDNNGINHNSGIHNNNESMCSNNEEEMKLAKLRIKELIGTTDVVLFMKGTPTQPKCGFSKMAASILSNYPIKVAAVNVLDREMIRQAVKEYTSWPTVPQIFIKGEFIGGADILSQMEKNGELKQLLERKNLLITENNTSNLPPSS